MASQDGGEAVEDLPGESIGNQALDGIKSVYGRYRAFQDYIGGYSPYAVRTLEVLVATILFFGFLYWLYLFLVVGA